MVKVPYILAVDDDKNFLEVISDKLKSTGFLVGTVNSADEAIKSIKEKRPDLVLLDVQMPQKSGIEVVKEIQNDPKMQNLKIVFLTNFGDIGPYVSDINKHFAQQIGATDYIKKTSDFDRIIDKINELLHA